MENREQLPPKVVTFFESNRMPWVLLVSLLYFWLVILKPMLDPNFDPFQHFVLSESFDVDGTLATIQEGLKLVDEELESLVCKWYSYVFASFPARSKTSRSLWPYLRTLTVKRNATFLSTYGSHIAIVIHRVCVIFSAINLFSPVSKLQLNRLTQMHSNLLLSFRNPKMR